MTPPAAAAAPRSRSTPKALIYEIARSELGYTGRARRSFAAQVIAANIREGIEGPVFIQGDHVQSTRRATRRTR